MSATQPVLVIHQYAIPRDQGGGTRHVDLFGRLEKWTPTIIATNFSHTSRTRITTTDPHFVLIGGPAYSDNGLSRIAGWGTFAAGAFFVGLTKRAKVVYGSSPQMLAPLAAWALAAVKRVPFVLEVRDLWPESIVAVGSLREGSRVHRVLVGLEKFLYRRAARIVVVTDGWQDHMIALGADPGKLAVVPNGTEVSDFEVTADRAELREKYRIKGFTAIYAGAHGAVNGLDLIIDAAAGSPAVNFLLIGEGTMKKPTQERVRKLGLTNVEFRDPIPKSELPALLKACDVGLHVLAPLPVFDKGASPNKLFDCMAAGLPVVTNTKYPLRNVIVDDQVGAVVEPAGIAEGLARVMAADEATLARWRAAAIELMASRYSRSKAASTLERVLDEAAAEHARRKAGHPGPIQRVVGAFKRVCSRSSWARTPK